MVPTLSATIAAGMYFDSSKAIPINPTVPQNPKTPKPQNPLSL
jgi:hypothetical protein